MGATRNRIAAIDATHRACHLLESERGLVFGLGPDGERGTVYVGGLFTSVNGGTAARNNLAAFNATTGIATGLNPGSNDTVYSLVVSGGLVYTGGQFTTVNGALTRNRLAAFDATTGVATAWDPNANSFWSRPFR